ncbi:hypothetical protein NLJ89_g6101 [Agrocybe chaxingu]|uniref:Uncharacterized protein n=1 Tax=Agrocybe chaxingu TaxID=84603 RepID=A0A9W8JYX9_9AGAR|nr:hypothetical protein NLJ89_g6101 [Agrocybe chaxingu]
MKASLFLSVAAFIAGTNAAVATLYEISVPPNPNIPTPTIFKVIQSGTTDVSAIGTGTDGKTTYVQKNILSLYVVEYPLPTNTALTTTATVVTAPETLAVTFAEDGDGYHATRSPSLLPTASATPGGLAYQPGLDEECTFNHNNGTGSCVRVAINIDENSRTIRSTTTYTGSLLAWTTLGAESTGASSTGNAAPTTNAAVGGFGGSQAGWLGVSLAVVLAFTSGLGLLW